MDSKNSQKTRYDCIHVLKRLASFHVSFYVINCTAARTAAEPPVERSSTRVNQAPGGKSSIVFGEIGADPVRTSRQHASAAMTPRRNPLTHRSPSPTYRRYNGKDTENEENDDAETETESSSANGASKAAPLRAIQQTATSTEAQEPIGIVKKLPKPTQR